MGEVPYHTLHEDGNKSIDGEAEEFIPWLNRDLGRATDIRHVAVRHFIAVSPG
ncbi:unnamed protein product [Penicillium roqueforti FM164]|uniref:Str. FM013 n=2 Tax=Penicillium TaxID=5073 RepID=A0A0G4PYF3_PENC3|nr:unnamed protein product [Penicillium roqueforti FM164]CRL31406.1 unnamed protein product [Penicillium camemberti]